VSIIDTNVDAHLGQGLRDRAADLGDEDGFYEQVLATIAVLPQRRSFLRWPSRVGSRTRLVLAAVALLGLLAGGVLLAGSGIVRLPSLPPSIVPPIPTVSSDPFTEIPSDAPTALPTSSALIAYVKFGPLRAHTPECPTGARRLFSDHGSTGVDGPSCSRIWVSNTDGTGAHELVPDHPGNQTPRDWSPDGTLLLFEDAAGLWLVDASGTIVRSFPFEEVCPIQCRSLEYYEFSPDGTMIAFERTPTKTSGESVIALMDVGTGQVTEIESTASSGNDAPHWSPDGTRLTFARQPASWVNGEKATLYMVNVDGSNLHQYVPLDLSAIEPRWSPDGSLIVFSSTTPDPKEVSDIYVIRPDGTGLRRLTTGRASIRPEWTADGRIVYARAVGGLSATTEYQLWIMDADGANQAKLPVEDLVQLTAAHCVTCSWVQDPAGDIPITEFMTNTLWQPHP
jgi:Tol biopolymer transport system component